MRWAMLGLSLCLAACGEKDQPPVLVTQESRDLSVEAYADALRAKRDFEALKADAGVEERAAARRAPRVGQGDAARDPDARAPPR